MVDGGFPSWNTVSDALRIGLTETGVTMWALDAETVDEGGLGVRTSLEGEPFGSAGQSLAAGRLVVADPLRIHALLFGGIAPGHEVSSRTTRMTLFSVAVDGVPAIHVEEAMWITTEVLGTG